MVYLTHTLPGYFPDCTHLIIAPVPVVQHQKYSNILTGKLLSQIKNPEINERSLTTTPTPHPRDVTFIEHHLESFLVITVHLLEVLPATVVVDPIREWLQRGLGENKPVQIEGTLHGECAFFWHLCYKFVHHLHLGVEQVQDEIYNCRGQFKRSIQKFEIGYLW